MNAIEFARDNGNPRIVSLLEHYSALPPPIQIITLSPAQTEATVTITLPAIPENHPLFRLTQVEVSFKKSNLLGSSTQLVKDVTDADTVVFGLKVLQPGTEYKLKARCSNRNGFGEWKTGVVFATIKEVEKEEKAREVVIECTESDGEQMVTRRAMVVVVELDEE